MTQHPKKSPTGKPEDPLFLILGAYKLLLWNKFQLTIISTLVLFIIISFLIVLIGLINIFFTETVIISSDKLTVRRLFGKLEIFGGKNEMIPLKDIVYAYSSEENSGTMLLITIKDREIPIGICEKADMRNLIDRVGTIARNNIQKHPELKKMIPEINWVWEYWKKIFILIIMILFFIWQIFGR